MIKHVLPSEAGNTKHKHLSNCSMSPSRKTQAILYKNFRACLLQSLLAPSGQFPAAALQQSAPKSHQCWCLSNNHLECTILAAQLKLLGEKQHGPKQAHSGSSIVVNGQVSSNNQCISPVGSNCPCHCLPSDHHFTTPVRVTSPWEIAPTPSWIPSNLLRLLTSADTMIKIVIWVYTSVVYRYEYCMIQEWMRKHIEWLNGYWPYFNLVGH